MRGFSAAIQSEVRQAVRPRARFPGNPTWRSYLDDSATAARILPCHACHGRSLSPGGLAIKPVPDSREAEYSHSRAIAGERHGIRLSMVTVRQDQVNRCDSEVPCWMTADLGGYGCACYLPLCRAMTSETGIRDAGGNPAANEGRSDPPSPDACASRQHISAPY